MCRSKLCKTQVFGLQRNELLNFFSPFANVVGSNSNHAKVIEFVHAICSQGFLCDQYIKTAHRRSGLPSDINSLPLEPLEFKFQIKMAYTNGF
jgi:hypothetical protein